MKLRQIETFHDGKHGELRGRNLISVISSDGISLAHLGDLGHELSGAQLEELGSIDVLLIPVGGYYTIDAKTAKKVADAIAPRVLVPMHYRFGAHGYPEIGTLDEFLALYEAKKIHKLDGNSFELTKNAPAGVIVPRFAE